MLQKYIFSSSTLTPREIRAISIQDLDWRFCSKNNKMRSKKHRINISHKYSLFLLSKTSKTVSKQNLWEAVNGKLGCLNYVVQGIYEVTVIFFFKHNAS